MKVAVMGYGVVGSGVVEVLQTNNKEIVKRSGQESVDIKYILDLRDFPGDPNEDKFIKDFSLIPEDKEISVVVETMGGLKPAFDFVMACLKSGKSVVTSNKELVAAKGYELLEAAKENNVNFLFEASVGGGIPVIRPMSQCLAANKIEAVAGILNGTTNFILTKMVDDNMDFAEALKLAQENGYAERNPAADVEGMDACRKICILASLAYEHHVYPDGIYTEGITNVTLEDVAYAENWGGVIKLIGATEPVEDGDKIAVYVRPCFVSSHSQLSNVNDVFNAVLVRGDALGDSVFYGKGAGKLPTASAVVADVIDCARHLEKRKLFGWGPAKENFVADTMELPISAYVRFTSSDAQGAKAALTAKFGGAQELKRENQPENEKAVVICAGSEKSLREELESLSKESDFKLLSLMKIADF